MIDVAVKWPTGAVDDGADLSGPLANLLRNVGFMAPSGEEGDVVSWNKGTPPSLQLIKSGALAASKGWSATIAALGGGTAIITAWTAWKANWDDVGAALQITYVAAITVLIATTALAIALVVRADVSGRAQAAAAEYQARAEVVAAFMKVTRDLTQQPFVVGAPEHWISKANGARLPVNSIRFDSTEGLVFVTDTDEVPASVVKRAGVRARTPARQ